MKQISPWRVIYRIVAVVLCSEVVAYFATKYSFLGADRLLLILFFWTGYCMGEIEEIIWR